jgi:hypothetical protein
MKVPEESPVGIIDPFVQLYVGSERLDIGIPKAALRDDESLAAWPSSSMVKYLFRSGYGAPSRAERDEIATDLNRWLKNLDNFGITRAGIPLYPDAPAEFWDRIEPHQDRIFVTLRVDPHEGMRGLREVRRLVQRYPMIRSLSLTPFQIYPFIAPNSKEYYPIYATAVDLDLAVFINIGFPGPRVPAWVQDPIHLDEVCWFFPDLRIVMRHGGEPWEDVCVKMLMRWPNLYYATTAFAPKYYPRSIIDFANTRGADKIIWAGYWPNLPYERVMGELGDLPLKDDVWPKFLAGNAMKAFRLGPS